MAIHISITSDETRHSDVKERNLPFMLTYFTCSPLLSSCIALHFKDQSIALIQFLDFFFIALNEHKFIPFHHSSIPTRSSRLKIHPSPASSARKSDLCP